MAADNIQVAIKVRPLLKKEKESKLTSFWKIVDNSIQLVDSQSDPFYFDHIFDEEASNEKIFRTIGKPIVDAALRGFNGTIFAYGQTSSGKTYTMLGDEINPGVMIRAVLEIFKQIEMATDRQFLIRVGYIEIYNEKIYDLLDKKNQDLKIYETSHGEVSVNCTDYIIRCEQDMLDHLQTGNKARRIGETSMNERSSRSHAIFRIIIESREFDKPQTREFDKPPTDESAVQISHLNLVDLAGSERADQTGATGSRLKEGCHINKSLLSLSLVIKKLSENESDKFINYRDSKLTRILQASLGGNALTAIICTIKSTAVDETSSTLSFAMRAKSIKNKPHKNEILSESAMMKRLSKEISRLQNELEVEKSKNSKIKILQLERQIKDAELKIVHSHTLTSGKQNQLRRRTWCPSTRPDGVLKRSTTENEEEDDAQDDISPTPHMFMTPLITLREHQQQLIEMPEEKFIPATEMEFSRIEERNMVNGCMTPEKKFSQFIQRISLTPVHDIRARYKDLESEFEELQEYLMLEKDSELCEARKVISELEVERNELLEIRDNSYESQVKLERSQQRCLELESRINELTEKVQLLETKQNTYQIEIEQQQQQIKSLLMASKDAESVQFELDKYKENSKSREQELLELVGEREKQIERLQKHVKSSTVEKSGDEISKEIDVSGILSESIEAKVTINAGNRTEKIIDDQKTNVECLKKELDEFKKRLSEKEKHLEELNTKLGEMQLKNIQLEESNIEYSDQIMEHVYENEALNNKCKEFEKRLSETEKVNTDLKQQIQEIEYKLVPLKNAVKEQSDFQSDGNLISCESRNGSVLDFARDFINEVVTKHCGNSDCNGSFPSTSTDKSKSNGPLLFRSESFEKLNASLKEQVSHYEALNQNMQERLDAINSTLHDTQSKNAEFLESIEKLRLSEKTLQEKLNGAESRLRELENIPTNKSESIETTEKYMALCNEISALKEHIKTLENDKVCLEEKFSKFSEMKDELAEADDRKMQLNELLRQKNEWKAIMLQSENDVAKLKEQVTELQKQLYEMRFEKEATTEKTNESLKQFEDLQIQMEKQQAFIDLTKQQLEVKDSKIVEFQSQIEAEREKSETLMKDKQELVQTINEQLNQIATLEDTSKTLREHQNHLIEVVRQVESDFREHEKEMFNLKKKLNTASISESEMQACLSDLKLSVAATDKQNKEMKESNEQLLCQIKELEERNGKLSAEISVLNEEKVELTEKLKDMKASLSEVEKLNTELKETNIKHLSEITELRNSKITLEVDVNTLKRDQELLEGKCEEDKRKIYELQLTLDNSRTLVQNMEDEYTRLKQTLNKTSDELCQLRQERDSLLEVKQQLENEFQRKLTEECAYTVAELTNVRSENLVLTDKMETLAAERNDLQVLLNKNVSRTKELESEIYTLKENNEALRSANEDFHQKYSETVSENECLSLRISDYESTITELETELKRLQAERELIVANHKEQFEKASAKVVQMKDELQGQMQKFSSIRNENDGLKLQIEAKEAENRYLHLKLESGNDSSNSSLAIREKEELLQQLHEMQKMHIYKIKQYQHEIQELKAQITSQPWKSEPLSKSNKAKADEDKQKIIKSLLGENDELRLTNQKLNAELQETRTLSQKDRKMKRYSNHDETRSLSWIDSRDIGTMTLPTDKLCNCEKLDRELIEAKKALLIKECQINTLRMESKHHPLKDECETLKRAIEVEEADKKELRKELYKLKLKISEIYKETKKCDQCTRRSKTIFFNQCSQTDFEGQMNVANNSNKHESDLKKLQSKYEDLKRLCRLRNTRIHDLENQLSKKENNPPTI